MLRWLPILALAVLAALVQPSSAPAADRVHLLTVESVTVSGADSDVGNMANMIAVYSETTKTNQGASFAKLRQTTQPGNRDRIMQGVEDMRGKVAKNDVVLVYYSGHGAIDNQGPFLQLDDEGQIHRQEMLKKMRSLGGRLHLLITDCCAVEVPPKKSVRMGLNYFQPSPERKRQLVDNLSRLFHASGIVDLNSASPKQVAWGSTGGGLFTKSLVKLLYESNLQDWQSLHRAVTQQTEQEYAKFRGDGLSDNGQRLGLGAEDLAQLQDQNRQTPHLFQLALGGNEAPVTSGAGTGNPGGAGTGNPGGNTRPPTTGSNTRPPTSGGSTRPPMTGSNTPPNLPPILGGSDDGPPMVPPVKPPLMGQGVVVARVYPETAATQLDFNGESVRLDKGDRILQINGRAIESPQQFHGAIDRLGKGADFVLKVLDRRTGQAVEVRGKLDSGGGFRFGALIEE